MLLYYTMQSNVTYILFIYLFCCSYNYQILLVFLIILYPVVEAIYCKYKNINMMAINHSFNYTIFILLHSPSLICFLYCLISDCLSYILQILKSHMAPESVDVLFYSCGYGTTYWFFSGCPSKIPVFVRWTLPCAQCYSFLHFYLPPRSLMVILHKSRPYQSRAFKRSNIVCRFSKNRLAAVTEE